MTPIGADAVTAITNRFVAPEVVDGVYTSNILLARWYRGNKIMRQGGTQIEQPMIYRKGNNGGWYRGAERLTLAPQDNLKNFVFGWKQCQQTVTIDGLTLLVTDSPEAIANHIQLQMDQAKMDMMEDLAVGLFGGGGNVSGGDIKAIDGLGAAVDDGTDAASYGGQLRSGQPWTQAYVNTSSTLTAYLMRQVIGTATIGGNSPTIIVSRQEQYDRFWKILQDKQQFQTAGGGSAFQDVNAGFTNLFCEGIPWFVDSHVSDGANGSNSDILVLNERMFTLYVSPRGNLKIEDWQTPVDMDAITTKMLWAGNLVCKSPRTQAKLANITG